ncbi:MAG: DUF401 family protein [Vulcanimicrobiota bacterium]
MADLLKLAVIFALILILLRRKLPLGPVMLLATLILGILSGFGLLKFFNVVLKGLTDPATIMLLVFLYMVSLLEKIERESGKLDRLITALERYVPGRRLRLIVMPAFLGFLASPGGAMFSAPFVERAGEPLGLSGEQKTFINYWFRHIWEYSLPLYPATILAATILNTSMASLIGNMWWCTLAAVAGGVIFGLMPLRIKKKDEGGEKPQGRLGHLFWGIFPVAALLIMIIAFKVNMVLALLIVVVFEAVTTRVKLSALFGFMKKSMSLDIFLAVVAILIFKEALTESTLATGVSSYFGELGIPIPLLFFILPFLVAFLTGVTQAPIGITFPLLLSMAPMPESLPLFCFGFSSAVIGVLLSPTHLCFILTAQYFKVDFTRVYRYMILPLLFLLVCSVLLFLV